MAKPYYLLEITNPRSEPSRPIWLLATGTAGPAFTADVHQAWRFTSSALAANALRRLTEQYGESAAEITITEHIDMDPTNEPIDNPATSATPETPPPGHRFGATIGARLLLAGEAVTGIEEGLDELCKNADQATLAGTDLDDETFEILRVAFDAAKRTQPPDDLLARLVAVLPSVMPVLSALLNPPSCFGDGPAIDPYPESPGHGYGYGTVMRPELVPGAYFEPIVDEDGVGYDVTELDIIGSRAGLLGTGRWILPTDAAWTSEGFDAAPFRILHPTETTP